MEIFNNSKDDFKSKIFETIEWYLKNKNLIKINPKIIRFKLENSFIIDLLN